MKTGFKNILEEKDTKKMKSPWNFDAPPYDERSSCYVNTGSHYGVGHTQPIGSKEHKTASPIPMGRHTTLKTDEIPHKNEILDIGR